MKGRYFLSSDTGGAWIAIFAVSLALRLALTLINRDANDSHIQVVEIILRTGSLPTGPACWECFQPKQYHATVAVVINALGLGTLGAQTLAAQLINFIAGSITLGLVGRFLWRWSEGSESLRLLAFAFVAFNPKLIGISAQATNDAFVIGFSTVTLCALLVFLDGNDRRMLLVAGLGAALAISSKTNGWVVFLAAAVALASRAMLHPRRSRAVADASGWMVLVPMLVVLNPLSQYRLNYRNSGSPLAINLPRQPLPAFMEKTDRGRPGLRSIQDGLLTFKFVDLLEHPRIENGSTGYPDHRTSLWTQLYGRAHSVSFDNWPPSWGTTDARLFPSLRALFVLALLPTGLILLGGTIQVLSTFRNLYGRDSAEAGDFGLLPLSMWGSIASLAAYALAYRDYSVMKAIFLFPALLSFPAAFVTGADWLSARAKTALFVLSVPLIGIYWADVIGLIVRLLRVGA